MSGACGDCTMCCRVFAIAQLQKSAGKWCQHCDIGKGCKVYDDRPAVCIDFECLWLMSQTEGEPMPPEFRPDRCKVVFTGTTDPQIIAANTMPGMSNAWRNGIVRDLINHMVKGGFRIAAGVMASRTMTMIDKNGERTVELSEPDQDGMQWGND